MNFVNLKKELKLRGYSKRTIDLYIYYNQKFLLYCNKSSLKITNNDIKSYLESLIDKNKSRSTIRLVHNALKFYYSNFLGKSMMNNIPLIKRDKKIIVPLSKEEVVRLINSITNKKHKTIVELIYASGLRVSEVVNLKVKDIYPDEKMAIIRSGKGRKDRVVILSNKFVENFQYQFSNPNDYLFKGRNGHLTIRSVQQIIKNATKKAGIKKRVYPHLLRHSFATHLLNANVDIAYIQKMLGHSNIKTTESYVHADTHYLEKITSPLDNL